MHKGSCLCGAVTFETTGPLRASIACHCTQCRKVSGHYWSATSVPKEALSITRADGLKWYRSSPDAQRGFCSQCGATLFWKPEDEPRMSIASGVFDGPTGITTAKHIYCADKGDYYEIAPEAEQHPGAGHV